jgi:hypothetical protein
MVELGQADVVQMHWRDWRLWFYFGMLFAGGLGLTVLLLTMTLSGKLLRRNPVLISLCFSWWLCPFPCLSLLLFTNSLVGDTQPDPTLCLVSATLVTALTPMVSVAGLAIVYHIWSTLVLESEPKRLMQRIIILVILPYIVFMGFSSAAVTIGLLYPDKVVRASFYCVVQVEPLLITVGAFSFLACLIAVIMEVWIAVVMLRHRDRAKKRGTDVQLVFRIFAFGFYLLLGLGLSIVSVVDFSSIIPDMFFSTYGLAVFIIFGSQKDVLRTWRNLGRKDKNTGSEFQLANDSKEMASSVDVPSPRSRSFAPTGRYSTTIRNSEAAYPMSPASAYPSSPLSGRPFLAHERYAGSGDQASVMGSIKSTTGLMKKTSFGPPGSAGPFSPTGTMTEHDAYGPIMSPPSSSNPFASATTRGAMSPTSVRSPTHGDFSERSISDATSINSSDFEMMRSPLTVVQHAASTAAAHYPTGGPETNAALEELYYLPPSPSLPGGQGPQLPLVGSSSNSSSYSLTAGETTPRATTPTTPTTPVPVMRRPDAVEEYEMGLENRPQSDYLIVDDTNAHRGRPLSTSSSIRSDAQGSGGGYVGWAI